MHIKLGLEPFKDYEKLKEGDTVLIRKGFHYCHYEELKVVRLTKTQIIMDNGDRYCRQYGHLKGHDSSCGRHNIHVLLETKEQKKAWKMYNLRSNLPYNLKEKMNYTNMSYEDLIALEAIFERNKKDG